MTEPFWLTRQMVVAIHDEQLTIHGGASGLRDEGMLESALDRPKNRWSYEQAELAELAAAYAFGIARNHPFVDGNKRAAITVTAGFLKMNGYRLEFDDLEAYSFLIGLYESGEMRFTELETWLREHAFPEESAT